MTDKTRTVPWFTEESPGGFITRWFCHVPAKEAIYRVLRDEWHDGIKENGSPQPVRDIWKIEITRYEQPPVPSGDRSRPASLP